MTAGSWATANGPVEVTINFFLVRPASAPKSRLRTDRRPDLDKLVRSTLDAITTAEVYAGDGRVVRLTASKNYAHDRLGARVTVE